MKDLQKNQQGITLFLAILILSAIMAIAFSIATILFVEVRISGDLMRTEPALYAANGITEEALFTVRRGFSRCFNEPCTGQFSYTKQLGRVNLSNPAPNENPFNDAILTEKILSTSNTASNSVYRYALYDPTDVNKKSNYSQIKITYKDTDAGGGIHVFVCEFKVADPALPLGERFDPSDPDPIDCSNINSNDMIYRATDDNTSPFSPNRTFLMEGQDTDLIILNPNRQQEILVYAEVSGLTPNADRYIQIEAFGPDDSVLPADADVSPDPRGVPYFGETVVDIFANEGGVIRALRVKIPEN